MMSSPAAAALTMSLGGYFDGYGVYADNSPPAGTDLHKYEFRRDSDLFVNGEATLDNGLTLGVHTDLNVGQTAASADTNAGTNTIYLNQEYAYGSGGWGRVNLGVSDGAAYLLQVAAPSADSNVDGIRTSIQALNPATNTQDVRLAAILGTNGTSTELFGGATNGDLGYAQDNFRQTDRITYLTPKFNGFQAGASFAPQPGITSATGIMPVTDPAVGPASAAATFKNIWEGAARWDGEFQGIAGSLGAGYSGSSLDGTVATPTAEVGGYNIVNGVKTWNFGGNVAFSGFSLGGIYKESKVDEQALAWVAHAYTGTVNDKTYDIGLGYDNGPYHVGASYLHDKTIDPLLGVSGTDDEWLPGEDVKDTRYTLGGGYTFAPGVTFRGSVAWGKFQDTAVNGLTATLGTAETSGSNDYTQVAIGTDIQF
jgi:outer membrane protein OmpU